MLFSHASGWKPSSRHFSILVETCRSFTQDVRLPSNAKEGCYLVTEEENQSSLFLQA